MNAKVAQLELFRAAALRDVPSYRDDIDLMALPCFSLSKTPRHDPIEYEYEASGRRSYIRVVGGEDGIATMWDNDVLIWVRTTLQNAINRGDPISNRIQFTVADFLRDTGRGLGGKDYEAFLSSLKRLKTTTIFTNITTTELIADEGFGWIQSYRLLRSRKLNGDEHMSACEIVLSDWVFEAIRNGGRAIPIDPCYFEIRGGLERKLFMVASRHVGRQASWQIYLSNLYAKVGSQTPLRRFKHELLKLIEQGGLPLHTIELAEELSVVGGRARRRRDPMITFRPKRT